VAGAVQPLIEALAEIPEVRDRHGRRHPLVAMLAMACAAMLCGYRSYSAIAEWGRNYDRALVEALGFTRHPTPCAATFFLVFRALDRTRFEAVLGAWAEGVLTASGTPDQADALALDGKTLRGSRKQGAPGTHLLSAVSHRLGLTAGQVAVDDKTNEIGAVATLLQGLLVEGRVVTMDALLTQRAVAQTIVEHGGDYVMIVKGNQPCLQADLVAEFDSPPPAATDPGQRRRRRTGVTVAMRSGA